MNNQQILNEIYQEPVWHKWIDAAVLLFVGVVCGIVFMQGIKFYDVNTTTNYQPQIINERPIEGTNPGSGEVSAPQKALKFEQV